MARESNNETGPIPDKRYFRIGEVGEITGLESHVLRFWENQFKGIRPKRTPAGQRLYRKKDVEQILTIKDLLHARRFTIEGARKFLLANRKKKPSPETSTVPKTTPENNLLEDIRLELENIRKLLA